MGRTLYVSSRACGLVLGMRAWRGGILTKKKPRAAIW